MATTKSQNSNMLLAFLTLLGVIAIEIGRAHV